MDFTRENLWFLVAVIIQAFEKNGCLQFDYNVYNCSIILCIVIG